MALLPMHILVVGGCHVSNYGVQPYLSFVEQWVMHLQKNREDPIQVDRFGMVKLDHIPSLMSQHKSSLDKADLIVLQLGHFELCWRRPFRDFFQTAPVSSKPSSCYKPTEDIATITGVDPRKLLHIAPKEQLKNQVKIAFLTLYQRFCREIPFLSQFKRNLVSQFEELRPYSHKITVLTPFPTLNKLDQWLRWTNHSFIVRAATQAGFKVADTFTVIPRQKSFFLADDVHLNSLGHLAVALYLSDLPLLSEFIAEML